MRSIFCRLGNNKIFISARVNCWAHTLIVYINYLPPRIITLLWSVVIFADDASVIPCKSKWRLFFFSNSTFIPWIRTGLQNPYEYGNSHICLRSLEVKSYIFLWDSHLFHAILQPASIYTIICCFKMYKEAMTVIHYKNVRTKVLKCCANIYFNWQCLIKKVIPKYANIGIPHTSPATNITQKKIHTIQLKDEIKFLYKKKEKLNKDLYNIHLKAAQEWGNTWHIIQDFIHKSTNQELAKILTFRSCWLIYAVLLT